jgi:hypothetical protein
MGTLEVPMSRLRFILAAVAIAVAVLAGSSDPDGWAGASGVGPAVRSSMDLSSLDDARRPAGRRWASFRDEGRRWSVAVEPHGRRWRS